jgi:probable phosphoglycerate mutase
MTELILIRHGETDWNVEHRIQGHLDIPLNEAGLAQADAIGVRFRGEKVDVLISSDLCRAMQTVNPIANVCGLPVLRDVRLRERHLGVLQGKTTEQAQQLAPTAFEVFRSRATDAALEGGESLAEFAQRVINTLTELAQTYRNKRIVAVTHGGVVDIAYRHANKTPLDAPRLFPIHNASVNTLRASASGFELVSWSDISHLPDQEALDEL